MARLISVETIDRFKKLEEKYSNGEWIVFDYNEASEFLGVKKSTLYSMVQNGKKLGYFTFEKERKNAIRAKILWEKIAEPKPKQEDKPIESKQENAVSTEVVEDNQIVDKFTFDGPFGKLTALVDKDNNPLFIAKQVCNVLGLSDVSMSLKKLDDDEKLIQKLFVSGQYRKIFLVNESGFYNLVLRSNKPQAKKFKKWVTAEVLPSIRKHGMYATPQTVEELLDDPDAMITLLQKLKEERNKVKEMSQQIEDLSDKAEYAETIALSEGVFHIGTWVKTISREHNVVIGRTRAFKWLRDNGYLMKNNEPYQVYVDKGWFEVKVKNAQMGDVTRIVSTTFITPEGQIRLTPKIVKDFKEQ